MCGLSVCLLDSNHSILYSVFLFYFFVFFFTKKQNKNPKLLPHNWQLAKSQMLLQLGKYSCFGWHTGNSCPFLVGLSHHMWAAKMGAGSFVSVVFITVIMKGFCKKGNGLSEGRFCISNRYFFLPELLASFGKLRANWEEMWRVKGPWCCLGKTSSVTWGMLSLPVLGSYMLAK